MHYEYYSIVVAGGSNYIKILTYSNPYIIKVIQD